MLDKTEIYKQALEKIKYEVTEKLKEVDSDTEIFNTLWQIQNIVDDALKYEKLKPELPFKIKSIFLPKDRLDELEVVPLLEDGSTDYWQAAKLLCEKDGGRLPRLEELGELATYLYNYPRKIGAKEDILEDVTLDLEKAKPFLDKSPFDSWFDVWSRTEDSSSYAYDRYFYSGGTSYVSSYRYHPGILAVCIED